MGTLKFMDGTALKLALLWFINRLPFFILKLLPLSVMVNEVRVRSSIKRLFTNSAKEVLGEIFQNSQRAGAGRVVITTGKESLTISDNGTGIDGVDGFHALLKIAESQYKNELVETDQRPMGLGLAALLSFTEVRQVTFISGSLELAIDTSRWFEDERYYRTWFKRLRSLKEETRGLTIKVECSEKVVQKVREALKVRDSGKESSAAQGYAGILEIELDGTPVETRLPNWANITETLVDTRYMGSRLLIGFTGISEAYSGSTVSWYGQLIRFNFSNTFTAHLEVREGHPLNPKSPVRDGLIQNETFDSFIRFAKDALFDYLFAPENRSLIKASWVAAYYELDSERATRDAPYYVASPRLALDHPGSTEDMDVTGEPQIFAYEDFGQPLLLKNKVMLLVEGKEEEVMDYGIASFIPLIGPVFRLDRGDKSRLRIGRIYWRPGAHVDGFFYEPGEFAVSFIDQPEDFLPVTVSDVFVFRYSANWSPEEAEFFATTTDQIEFLNVYTWAAWCYEHDEASSYELEDAYRSVIRAMVREIIGNCVESTFSLYDLGRHLPTKDARIQTILVQYEGEIKSPTSLLVSNERGEEVRLKLMY